MKIKRLTILVCIMIMLISLALYFAFDTCRNEFMLSFFSSGLISLLLELPATIILKNQTINSVFYTLNNLKTDSLIIKSTLNKMLDCNDIIIVGLFKNRIEKMCAYKEMICQIDIELFLSKNKNQYLQSLKHNVTINQTLFQTAIEKMDLSINTLKINKSKSGIQNDIFSKEITLPIQDVIKTLDSIISTCDLYIDLIYNDKYKILWKLYEESINETILMNELNK